MENYETKIMQLIKGQTPKEKYYNLNKINTLLISLCYPKRGTVEEDHDVLYFADEFNPLINKPQ